MLLKLIRCLTYVAVITILRGLLALGALYAAVYLGSIKKAEIPPNLLKDLAQKYYGNSLDLPLEGKVVIITGSTSGVGKGAAKELHKVHTRINNQATKSRFVFSWEQQ